MPEAAKANVTSLAQGEGHVLALKRDGRLVQWGRNDEGQATPPANLTAAVAVACGTSHSLALLANGSVVTWGSNYTQETSGVLRVPAAAARNVVRIAAGNFFSMAVVQDDFPSEGAVQVVRDNRFVRHEAARRLTGVPPVQVVQVRRRLNRPGPRPRPRPHPRPRCPGRRCRRAGWSSGAA